MIIDIWWPQPSGGRSNTRWHQVAPFSHLHFSHYLMSFIIMAPWWKLSSKICPCSLKLLVFLYIFIDILFTVCTGVAILSLYCCLMVSLRHWHSHRFHDLHVSFLCPSLVWLGVLRHFVSLQPGKALRPSTPSRGAAPLLWLMGKCSSGLEPSFQRFLSFKHKSQRKYPGLLQTTIAPSDARWQWEMSSFWLRHSNYFSHLTSVFIQTYCPGLCWHWLKSHILVIFFFFF